MLKSFKYRIYPSEDQIIKLSNIFGQVRFIYNLGLETKINAWKTHKKSISTFDLNNQIKDLKDHIDWIDAPSQSLQMAMKNLDSAYSSFFKGGGFPKFKNKYSKQSFQLPQGVHFKDNKVFIPKLKLVDIDIHREFKGEIETVTVSKSVTNKYYVSILVDNKKELPKKQPIKIKTSVGVDLGTSNMIKNHKLSRSIQDMGWYKFKSMLEYKCGWYGKNLRVIGRFDPSSKTCSSCGSIYKDLKLSEREWVCQDCGEIHDRDINAALNIRNFGLRNQPSISQSRSLDQAFGVETQKSLAFV